MYQPRCILILLAVALWLTACGTDTATSIPTPTATPSIPTATPTMKAPTMTATPSVFRATHGRPHIGGPFSDFVGKYGQPIGEGQPGSYNFQSDILRADGTHAIGPNVTPNASGEVIGLTIINDSGNPISFTQAKQSCEKWLPSDATEFNTAGNFVDYHSSVGEIVMMLNTSGDCVLSIAGQ